MKMSCHSLKRYFTDFAVVLVVAQVQAAALAANEFDVRDFGASGNGARLDTVAIQKTLDACGHAGGGTVRFPPGVYLTQPLFLRTKTTLQIDAGVMIKATDNPEDFLPPGVAWSAILDGTKRGPFTSLISGNDLSDIKICGGGTIDGSGARWWVPAEAARQRQPGYTLPRPNLIGLSRVKHLVVDGVTLQNSPKFHLVPDECEDVLIRGVTISAPEHAANTDAIDPSACRDVMITNCTLDVGDDDVAIKAGRKIPGRDFASENITVTACTFRHGHGMSIGSETAGGVRNVTVEHCTFANTENGLRIKSDVNRGGIVENIVYRDIGMSNVTSAITFTCFYMNNSAKDPAPGTVDGPARIKGENIPVYR
ncbi:MAG TPA: glycoside hydrolase family 28 protein, partial [Candidatus Acidoferrum sp.]|nr:glycoside hydrolase family 28 protein [Candidatus Acidoferrum sp.]